METGKNRRNCFGGIFVMEHPFFGSWKTEKDTNMILDELRGGRF